jgi:choice-of-anchor A domain-containing protein
VVAGGTLSCPNTCIADGNIHAAAESGTIYNNYSGGTNTVNSTQVIDFANNFAELKGLSTWLTAQTTTSGDSCSYNSASNTLTCTGTKAGLNVINIPTTGTVNAGLLGTANLEFTTTVSGATLVLNVAGASSALGTSYGFKATDKQKVLFNYSATSLTLGGTIDASVLAPWANVVTAAGASGQFTGNLIAQSFAGGGLEFENNLFNGDIPEPGTFVLMSAGLLLAVAARRRAKRPTA